MRSWKRLILYLLLNVLVSVAATLTVLTLWERNQAPVFGGESTLPPVSQNGNPADTQIHIVQPGDTLDSIAAAYGVRVEDLLAINQLENSESITAGQGILIPQNESTPTGSPGQGGAELPAGGARLEIVTIVGAGDLETERVVLKNVGPGQVSLEGWKLKTTSGEEYLFPRLNLNQDASVTVHTRAGQNTVTDLYWGRVDPAWKSGEIASLLDTEGRLQLEFTVP